MPAMEAYEASYHDAHLFGPLRSLLLPAERASRRREEPVCARKTKGSVSVSLSVRYGRAVLVPSLLYLPPSSQRC